MAAEEIEMNPIEDVEVFDDDDIQTGIMDDVQLESNLNILTQLCKYNNIDPKPENMRLVAKFIQVKNEKGKNIYYFDPAGSDPIRLNNRKHSYFSPLSVKNSSELLYELGYVNRKGKLVQHIEETKQLPAREIEGLEDAFTNIRDNIKLAASKIVKSQDKIDKLNRTIDEFPSVEDHTDEILEMNKEIQLESEKLELNQELHKELKGRMKDQISRLKDLWKVPLGERLKLLWKEEGITVVSIVTAVSMTISTIVLGITQLISKGGGTLGSIVRQGPKRILKYIIKSIPAIASFILSTMGKVASWVADHIYLTIFAIVSLSFPIIYNHLK